MLASTLPRRSIVFYFSSLENIINAKDIAEKIRALGHKPAFMIPHTPSWSYSILKISSEVYGLYHVIAGIFIIVST